MVSENSLKNLIPVYKRPPEEARAIWSKGGKNSGKNAARRRSMREWAQALGTTEIDNIDGDKVERNAVVILKQYEKALKGDTRAAKFIAEILGEYSNNINILNVGEDIVLKFD